MPRLLSALAVLFAVVVAPAADEPKKDEATPFYKSWAKHKPGTSVTVKMTDSNGEKTREVVATMKLTEVKEKDGKLVFDTEYQHTEDGKAEKPGTEKKEVGKSEQGGFPLPPFDPKTGKPEGTVDEGKEKLKVGGTEFECKWYKIEVKIGDRTAEGKVWVCDDFPGGLVKMTGKQGPVTQTITATDVTIKK